MNNEQTAREIAHKLMSDIGECWPEVIYTVPNGHTNVCNAVTEALNRASAEATERAAKVAEAYAKNMDRQWKAAPIGREHPARFLLHREKAAQDIAAAIRASGEEPS